MSDATTAVPAAIAFERDEPEALAAEATGRTATSAPRSRESFSASSTRTEPLDALGRAPNRRCSDSVWGPVAEHPAGDRQLDAR